MMLNDMLRRPLLPLVLACLLALGACDDAGGGNSNGAHDLGVTQDLTVAPVRDLATARDLAPRDLGGDEDGGSTIPDVVHALPGVTVTTLAGSSVAGGLDGDGAAARFDNPVGLALDANGLLYVTEYDGNRVRTVDATGHTGTVVADVTAPNDFACPFGVAIVSATRLLVQTDCDTTGAKTDGSSVLWTVDIASGTPIPRVQHLGRPRGLAVLDVDHAIVSDHMHHHLDVLGLATSALTPLAGALDQPGWVDATGSAARFDAPYGLCALGGGSVAVADQANHRLRRVVFPSGAVTTIAGDGERGTGDADHALAARFEAPKAIAVDADGDLFISDAGAHRIRRVGADGVVVTLAGDGIAGFRDGAGAQARFFGQEGIAVTPDGKHVYVADGNAGEGGPYHRIRAIKIP
jgi:DNA-binding beta-propeller fold protein YncE